MTPRRLTGREASIFACLTDALVAPGGPATPAAGAGAPSTGGAAPPAAGARGALPPVGATDAVSFFDGLLGRVPGPNRAGLRALLLALEVGPLALGFGARMRRLEPARRVEYLLRLERTPLGPLLEAVSALAKLCYYGDDGVMRLLGYDADAVVTRGRELRRAEGRW